MEEKLQQMTPAVAVVIGLVIAGLYYTSMFDDGTSRERKITEKKAENQKIQNEIKKMKSVIQEAIEFKVVSEKLGSELDTVLTAIPQDYNSTELMKLLSVEAKTVGLSILSLKSNTVARRRPDPRRRAQPSEEDKAFYDTFLVAVLFEGTFNQMMQFLSNLTKVNRIVIVKELDMNMVKASGGTASAQLLKLKAVFEAYRYKSGDPES